jgi:hypothetical protein
MYLCPLHVPPNGVKLLSGAAVSDLPGMQTVQALHPECNLLPETIGRAALKAEDALKVLQVRLAAG